jgi:hypothetical protein
MRSMMGQVKELTLESYLIDQEDYPRAVKQDTQRLGDVARVCRDYVTAMKVAVAVAGIAEAAEVFEAAEAAAGAEAVERERPNND